MLLEQGGTSFILSFFLGGSIFMHSRESVTQILHDSLLETVLSPDFWDSHTHAFLSFLVPFPLVPTWLAFQV